MNADTPEITRIRAALEAFDETPLMIGEEWALEDALQRVCNPAAMTAVLAFIDAQAAEIARLRDALKSMSKTQPCDCGCNGDKAVLLKPAHYYAIAKDALKEQST